MPQDHWPPRLDIVEVAIIVHVIEIWALSVVDENGFASNAAEGSYRAINSTG
jgi:hypothetical protein